jgi:arginine decarboxylase
MQSYAEFLDHSVGFPQDGFRLEDDELYFHEINLMEIIETYGTPLKLTYLPMISKKIRQARLWFNTAMLKHNYRGSYTYCYCTKSSHFKHVMEEVLKNGVQLETSSAFDMPIIDALEKKGLLTKDIMVICNGYKRDAYKQQIVDMIHDGYRNIIPVLDNKEEFNFYDDELEEATNFAIRIAAEEKPNFEFYTSRLGVRADELIDYYHNKFDNHPLFKVTMLHFFINSGIHDTPYYWNELEKHVTTYCKLKKVNPHLTTLDIGGGLPFKNSLTFEYDYQYMIDEIVRRIKEICAEHDVVEPDLVTEFGSFTVAESSCGIFKVLGRKQQNDREKWLMIDGSMITMLPDIWALNQRFILLPVNNWDAEYERVNIGGMTCDSQDFYNQEAHVNAIFMPKTRKLQYLGFFNTGAYQEVLSGVGGIHHCLIPTPKHVLIRRNKDETLNFEVLNEEQNSKQVLKILGYDRL